MIYAKTVFSFKLKCYFSLKINLYLNKVKFAILKMLNDFPWKVYSYMLFHVYSYPCIENNVKIKNYKVERIKRDCVLVFWKLLFPKQVILFYFMTKNNVETLPFKITEHDKTHWVPYVDGDSNYLLSRIELNMNEFIEFRGFDHVCMS